MYADIAINQSKIHPRRYHELIEQFGSAKSLLKQTDQFYEVLNLKPSVWKKLQRPDDHKITHTLNWVEKNQITLLKDTDKGYPLRLKELPCSPPLLYVKGNVKSLNKPGISIVGSRNASFYGLENTKTFA